jgi:very-short-patch-repair endonuclease
MMTSSDHCLPADYTNRVTASISAWKRKLLDLSRRNRALNFKPAKVSTIAIVDERPAEVFRRLYLEEGAMRFRPVAPAEDPALEPKTDQSDAETGGDVLEFDSESEEALEYVPYDEAAVDERHKDVWLQTKLDPEALDHALRRIDEQVRTTLEEQGVNTLFTVLGMLQYRESSDAGDWFRAPLVFVPVELSRKSARADFAVAAASEDAFVNPTLVELLRSNHGVMLPDLPDSETIEDAYDLQSFLTGVAAAVANKPGWSVQTDVYLGLFSFQKLVMFKDVEANTDAIKQHRLVQQLLSKEARVVVGLPSAIRTLPLDLEFTPEATHQVVDADSSQLRAIAAVEKGHDLVLEGPPGTGKSQTITNLVAQALAANRSVLFVAEKMAALEVVHRRLVDAGLGEFCLELHSSKANKRHVMKELKVALDGSLQRVAVSAAAARRLPEVRSTLAHYVRTVHEPFGVLKVSVFEAVGRLGEHFHAPKFKMASDVAQVTPDELASSERALSDLEVHARAVGHPATHPWRGATKTFYSEEDLDTVAALSERIAGGVRDLVACSREIAAGLGMAPAATLDDVASSSEIADVLADSPGVAAEILQSDTWNAPPQEVFDLMAKVNTTQMQRASLTAMLTDAAFGVAHADDAAYIERKSQGISSLFAFLDGRYRAIRRRWIGYRRADCKPPSLLEQAAELRRVDGLANALRELELAQATGRHLFGSAWLGSASDPARLDAYVRYVVRYRELAIRRGLASGAASIAVRERPDVSLIRDNAAGGVRLRAWLRELQVVVGWPAGHLGERPIVEIGARVSELAATLGKAQGWAAFESCRQRVAATVAREVLEPASTGALPFDQVRAAFVRAFFMKWLGLAVQAHPVLQRFDTLTHEELVKEFQDLDVKVLRQNRGALIAMLRDRVQHKLTQPEVTAALPRLQKEMVKQRKLRPLRRTLRECDAAVRAIKPCFMMSPLTVAQYLDGSSPTFDLVIFDEASQLPTEDAVGAIIRGRQLVVVGDPKQLPPTNFFAVSSGGAPVPVGDDGEPLYEDTDSVLEEFMGAAVPMSRLRWHYRSTHESLIAFSNVRFYEADLHTFPSVSTGTDSTGVQFHFVEGGVYEGKGINLVEARRVADEVVSFAKLQLGRESAGERALSLGVGTLNLRQQLAILDELEVRRRADPSIEPFFDRARHEPFFVKNLENIQGDERDSVFLSITYGKSADGRLRYNFGPLNRENGWRRLNVLVTRARQQMKVFSSMRDHDINPAGATSQGPELLKDFLAYAEHKRLATTSAAADAESPFERDVCLELERHGVRVQPQVGVSGYRVDLGVLDTECPGRFVCGIECDGVAYHSLETVRDRDRLRQRVLEDRGWIIHRVWSTDWFKDRQGQIDRLLKVIEASRLRVREEITQVQEAQAAHRDVQPLVNEHTFGQEPTARTYRRPLAAPYEVYRPSARRSGDILKAPMKAIADVVAAVVDVEGPLHDTDLIARVCGVWDTKAGSRIQDAIRDAVRLAHREQRIGHRGRFHWRIDGRCDVRTRVTVKIPGDRIAPEELARTVQLVLTGGHAFPRQELITEVRAVHGYNRTGPNLEQAIGAVVDALVASGHLGEGSGGLMLRVAQPRTEPDPEVATSR